MARLKYPRMSYFASSTDLTFAQVRGEYNRLRSAAQKRLKRLSGTEFARSETYQYYSGAFPSARGLSEADMRKALYDVAQFVSNDQNTLRGMRRKQEKAIAEMNSRFGEELVNKENYWDFIDFLKDKNMKDIAKGLDSDQVIELWRLREKGVPTRDIMKHFNILLDATEEQGYDPDQLAEKWNTYMKDFTEKGLSRNAVGTYFNQLESRYSEVMDYLEANPRQRRGSIGVRSKDLRRILGVK